MATLLLEKAGPAATPPGPLRRFSTPAADSFRLERRLALALIAVAALYLRMRDPNYTTAYMDESVYAVYGRMFLTGHFESPLDTPLQWSFGWYLWPIMSALADRLGGLMAIRELAAVLGGITVAATYGFASRVFSKTVGIGAALVMALLAPAVLVSRIATRDSGSIAFFALGLWAYAAAWQDNKKRQWLLAGLLFFAAFLCKYLVAIYFPVLVILVLRKGWKPLLLFAAPLFAACAAYSWIHWADLTVLLHYGGAYGSLRSPNPADIYLWQRGDFWLVVCAGEAAFACRQWRWRAVWMWVGALVILAFQLKSRADYDYWKHVNYALLFLVPVAVAGIIFLVRTLQPLNYGAQVWWSVGAVAALAVGAGALGNLQHLERFTFWPNVDPVLVYFENRLTAQDRVLVDDTVFRYYFMPPLHQQHIADPMYFHYRDAAGTDKFGEDAYKAAVAERAFSYIVLDGGMGAEARRMDAAIRPLLSSYTLRMYAVDPALGQNIEVYSRPDMSDAEKTPAIRLLHPTTGSILQTADGTVMAEGTTIGARAGWHARIEVFTNRWYPQGEYIPIAADGSFQQIIVLGGEDKQRCSHLLRARLYDEHWNLQASTLNYGIGRAGIPDCTALRP